MKDIAKETLASTFHVKPCFMLFAGVVDNIEIAKYLRGVLSHSWHKVRLQMKLLNNIETRQRSDIDYNRPCLRSMMISRPS